MKSIAEASNEMLQIKEHLSILPDGTLVSYEDIEKATGVIMDSRGKQYLRSAIYSLKREYACIRGWGIEFASATNADKLVGNRLIKIDRAVDRGSKTTRIVMKFLNDMTPDTQKRVLLAGSVFGAIKASAQLARQQYNEAKSKLKIPQN